MDWQTIAPKSPAHYLITVERPNGSRFVGYAFFDGRYWLTNNKQGRMHLNIVAWAFKPEPFEGEQVVFHQQTVRSFPMDTGEPYEIQTYGSTSDNPDPWENPFTQAEQAKISKHY